MKSLRTSAAWMVLAASTTAAPIFAQLQDNSEKQMTCSNGDNDGDRARHCEIREVSLPSIGRLTLDALNNGSASIKGWLRGDVLVRARIDASGDNDAAARAMASQVMIDGSGGQVRANGPQNGNNTWWSVSYEIFVPQTSDLSLKTNNGSIKISDIRGQIHFEGNNGSVQIKRVMGEVTGSTVNGSIQVELAGANWNGRQMDLSTRNGSVTVTMPPQASARVQAETGMGSIRSDFPTPPTDATNGRPRKMEFAIGAGGPTIHITTGNGSINLKKGQAQ